MCLGAVASSSGATILAMKICFVGFHNLPVLAPEYRGHTIGGEAVQQTLLARALERRGHDVSMVVADYGQRDGEVWEAIRVFKAYSLEAGLPVLRFIHPRWTGMWSALTRADADLYYTSCAGMQVGLLALFCRRFRKRFVFRSASDTDCGGPMPSSCRALRKRRPWRATTDWRVEWRECWSRRRSRSPPRISTFYGSAISER